MTYPPSAGGAPAHDRAELPPAVVEALSRLDVPVSGYLYDPGVAADRVVSLRAAVPAWCDVLYALKANAFPPVVAALAAVVDGFEVSSAAELAQATAAAASEGRALHTVASGPGKHGGLLRALVEGGVGVVNLESRLELERVAEIGRSRGMPVPVTLRVNPARVDVAGALVMGGGATPFGIPEEEVPDVLAVACADRGVDVLGFHVHAVSGNLDAAAHVAYVGWCVAWSRATAAAAGVDLRLVDAGGGLGVAFGGAGPSFDLAAFGQGLAELRPPDGCRVVLEPGRWVAADCGWYAAEVVDLKRVRGSWFAVVRGGINHFALPASWDIVHRFAVVPSEEWPEGAHRPEVAHEVVTVVGELCTPEDVLARDIRVERLRAGDVLVFPQAGSYGWEFALPRFLQHPVAPRLDLTEKGGPNT